MTASAKTSGFRQKLGYHPALLGLVVLISSAALVYVNFQTKDVITRRADEDLQKSLQQVVPADLYDNELLKDSVVIKSRDVTGQPVSTIFYRARNHGKIVALAFPTTGYGYSGAINMIIGIDTHGTLLGVRIIAHSETPGLGDKIEAGKSKWIFGFKGLSLGNPPESHWAVKKDGGDFDSFTGATITPRAVVAAIRNGLEEFSAHRDEVLKDITKTAAPTETSKPDQAEGKKDGR